VREQRSLVKPEGKEERDNEEYIQRRDVVASEAIARVRMSMIAGGSLKV